MNLRRPTLFIVVLLLLLAVTSGCARQKFNAREVTPADTSGIAKIQAVRVAADGSQVEISADRPLVYTFYKTSEPPKAVIDLSQTDPGGFSAPIPVNSGNVKTVSVSKHTFGPGTLSRVEFTLYKDSEIVVSADPANKAKLIVTFPAIVTEQPVVAAAAVGTQAKPANELSSPVTTDSPVKNDDVNAVKASQPGAAEGKESSPAEQVAKGTIDGVPVVSGDQVAAGKPLTVEAPKMQVASEAKTEIVAVADAAVQKPAATSDVEKTGTTGKSRSVTALEVQKDAVEIVVDGGVDRFELFSLPKPDRLVVDIFSAKNGMKEKSFPVESFGIGKARIGLSADKVRIVFDAHPEIKRPYTAVKTDRGLAIHFGEKVAPPPATGTLPRSGEPASQGDAVVPPAASALQAELVADKPAAAGVDQASPPPSPQAPSKKVEETTPKGAEPTTQAAPVAPGTSKKVVTGIKTVSDGFEILVSGGVDDYKVFMLNKPDRLVIDLPGIGSSTDPKVMVVNSFGVGKARLGSAADKVRIVFDAEKDILPPYQITKNDAGLKVVFGATSSIPAPPKGAGPSVVATPAEIEPKTHPAVAANAVDAIDFKLVDGYSRVAIRAGSACIPGKPAKVRDGLQLIVRNCQLPAKLQRSLNTSSFASVIKAVTPYSVKTRAGYDTRIHVKLRADAPSVVKQEGGLLLWDIKNTSVPEPQQLKGPVLKSQVRPPPAKAMVPEAVAENEFPTSSEETGAGKAVTVGVKPDVKKYSGRKVTLEFSDADVRKIFQLIAEVSNLNFLIADDVSGTISLKLVNVPWDQALDVILESKNLEMKRDGNIVQIKPRGRFKTLEEMGAEAKKAKERQMDLQTVVFDVNYASIGDIAGQLNQLKSVHDNVSVTVDARTNRVIVTDIAPSIEKMRELIKTLDMPEKQVMIEARIVEATTSFARDMGVQWGLRYSDGTSSVAGINNLTTSFGGVVSNVLPSGNTGGIATGVSFGKLASNIQLDLRLSAAATTGLIKIISTPKVVTLNNKAAKISQGQSIPYQTTSAEGTKTEFVQAALTLDVTPHITADGYIGMKIKASNNSPGAGTPPPINMKEATTELQVKNGETTVIGGIYVDSETESDTGVPFLKDIPLLGWLFKSSGSAKIKTELLIFITPRILI